MPQISVIMAVHNGYPYLETAIQSILAQTIRDFEFIIIDDASNDNTPSILNFISKEDSRIRIITNSVQSGLTHSLNIALEHAQGRYIARMDADDIAHSSRFEYQIFFLNQHPDIFLIGTSAYHINEQSHRIGYYKAITDPDQLANALRTTNHIYHPTIMFRNTPEIQYRDKFIYCQDYDFYLNLLSHNLKLANLAEPLLDYRILQRSISYQQNIAQQQFYRKAFEFFQQRQQNQHDQYDSFDTHSILSPTYDETSPAFLIARIKISFQFLNLTDCRLLCRSYFVKHGFLCLVGRYYIKSLIGFTLVTFFRKIKLWSFTALHPIKSPSRFQIK